MDTGAAVTAIPSRFQSNLSLVLKPARKMLRAAGNQNLQVDGVANVVLKINGRSVTQEVYIVKNLMTPLLGKPAIAG